MRTNSAPLSDPTLAPKLNTGFTRVSLAQIVLALAMIGAAALYLYPTMIAPLNIYDEGIIVYGATRVMWGEIPYRDFWTQYSPAQLYVLAGLFQVFGATIAVERGWDVAVRAVLAFVMFLLAARLTTRNVAFIVWLIGGLWVTYYGFFGYPIFAGLLFSLFSIYTLIRAFAQPRPWLLLSGLSLGVAALFRHDMAVYCAAAQSLVLLPFAFVKWTHKDDILIRRIATVVRTVLPFVMGALVVVGPVALFFVVNAPLNELIQQLFLFPLIEFPKVRDLPYPKLDGSVDNVQFYAPFVIYPLAVAVAIVRARSRLDTGFQSWGVVMVALFGLFGFNQARVRSDTIHTVHFFLSAVVLLPVLLRGFPSKLETVTKTPSFIISSVGVVLTVAAAINPIAGYAVALESRGDAERALKTTLPIALPGQMSMQQTIAVSAVQRLTKPKDKVYVGLSQHDRVFANDAMFYFLLQRPSATRYHELHPGLTNTLPVQQEMVNDLERNQVKYVVVTNMFEGAREPNDSALSTGVTLLDDYIVQHYRTAQTIGSYRILVRQP